VSDRAEQALEKIAKHEQECAQRWGEALTELRNLRKVADAHAARWERLAWLVVASAVTGVVTVVVSNIQ
jgi:Flp pilus assembly protein TadB